MHLTRTLLLVSLLAPAATAQGSYVQPLAGDLQPALSAGNQELPAIARGATNFLVVWEDDSASLGGFVAPPNGFHQNSNVYAARLDLNGDRIDAVPIVVAAGTFDQVKPRVAWNGENYLVTWTSSRPTQFYVTTGIYAARVAPDGTVLDDPPIVIEDGDDFDERDPVVASDGTNWAVFYTDFVQGQPAETLDAALVHPAGFVMQKNVVIGSGQSTQPVNVDVEFAVDRYLVAYERGYSGAYGRFVDTSLQAIGTQMTFQTNANKPEVATNGAGFFVSFSGVRGTPVDLAGNVAIPGGASYIGGGSAWEPETDCAWDGAHWTIAFSDLTFGAGGERMYLSQVSPTGVLEPSMPLIVHASNDAVREFALANGNGFTQVVWNDWGTSAGGGGTDPNDLLATHVNVDGGTTAVVGVSVSAPAQIQPAIAGDAAHGYLVAYLSLVSGVTRVHAQRLSSSGGAVDLEPIVLATGTRAIRRIDTAFDGTEWLVVWDDNFGTLRHTFGRRVALDGSVPDAAPVNLLRGERPTVAAQDGARRFLVASWDHNQSNEYIRATRVDGASTTALDAPYLTLGTGSGFPDALGFDDRWFVVWGGMRGVLVGGDGSVGANFYAGAAESETLHGLARDGDLALLAFMTSSSFDIHARRMMKDGTFLDPTMGFPVCQSQNKQFEPRAAFDGTDFIVTFTDFSSHVPLEPGLGDVRAARVTTAGTVPQLCGEEAWADVRIPEGDAEVADGAGGTMQAACVLRSEAPRGALRVVVRSPTPPQGGATFCAGDGSATACPCANPGASGHGCANSVAPAGALLIASGAASITNDALVLSGSSMPENSVLYFQGTSSSNGGQGVVFGDGLRCIAGAIVRLGTKANVGGASQYPGPLDLPVALRGGVTVASDRFYQAWYRNASAYCTVATFNLTNGVRVSWVP